MKSLYFVFLLLFSFQVYSQTTETKKSTSIITGAVTLTNNGISLIPTFSLGKPAAIFNLALGRKRLTFEPDFRWGLNAKPWSFIFWGRYKLVQSSKFKLNVGTHISTTFKSETFTVNSKDLNVLTGRRYFATEFVPNFIINKNLSVGIYYLYSHGLDQGTTLNNHFVTLNSSISNISLGRNYYAKLYPQVYFLKMDANKGTYANATISLARKNCPLMINSILNRTIKSDIIGPVFNWNVGLVYLFSNKNAR